MKTTGSPTIGVMVTSGSVGTQPILMGIQFLRDLIVALAPINVETRSCRGGSIETSTMAIQTESNATRVETTSCW
jgi:hypothetical protein